MLFKVAKRKIKNSGKYIIHLAYSMSLSYQKFLNERNFAKSILVNLSTKGIINATYS